MNEMICTDGQRSGSTEKIRRRRLPAGFSFAVVGVSLVGLAGAGVFRAASDPADAATALSEPQYEIPRDLDAMSVDNSKQIVVEGEEAQLRNASLPLAAGSLERVSSFVLADKAAPTGQAALTCLTQAIYYEAGFEPLQGRRAVAQVVLNRMRHPAYPNSVCGVVYQGSQRRTGCQFSFTCDGSLLRAPAAGAWRTAEEIARQALGGTVEPSVGTATHYHADYVLPRWAFTLGKIQQIGRHIFYRFNGRAGSAAAFTARYASFEAIPSADFAQLRDRAQEEVTSGLIVAPHVTDRHAQNDVGGRLDTRTAWRLNIPDPVNASPRMRDIMVQTDPGRNAELGHQASSRVASAEPVKPDGVAIP